MAGPEAAQTFLFADLAGFTALTEAHGDERAADLVGEFCSAVRALLPRYGAHEVKAIGDALLLRSDDAGSAIELALEIVHGVGGRHAFPSVRIGMHTGPAVAREGDWYGATVNLASRVSDHARAGEVVVTRATRDAAGEVDGVEFALRGRERFRNVTEPVELWSAGKTAAYPVRRSVTDPVCRMSLDPEQAEASTTWRGLTVYFCSEACAQAFAAAPARYGDERRPGRELRVSDRGRDRAVSFLRRAYERGELTLEDLDERVAHAYAARTRAETAAVLRDLPSFRRWQAARRRRQMAAVFFPPLRLIYAIRRWWRRRRERYRR